MTQKPLKTIAGATDRPLVIGDIEIPCYVLEGETRVLSQRGLQTGIGMSISGGSAGEQRMPRFVESLSEKGVATKDLTARIRQPIKFIPPGGGRVVHGYEATILADICDAVLAARDIPGALQPQQKHIAERCNILMRGFARIGIIGLVDEATGYQEIRARNALAKILERFLAEELQPWTMTFPLEFYRQIFRLRDWPWHYLGTDAKPKKPRTPGIVAHYTNDLVYERLAPGVLEELQRRNPTQPTGRRQTHHHRWFTRDIGHPKLKEHVIGIIALMKGATGWTDFYRRLQRAFPKLHEDTPLPLPEPDED
ncbi:MAG: P63C domain-containing protein [Proteobacteria bacterium]|nr:P63C domain-containing protein [Pseudomonadota bacterium]